MVDPLPINRRVLIWLYMLAPIKNTNRWKKSISICSSLAVCTTLVGCVTSSIAFVHQFISIDLKESLYAMFPIIACSGVIYVHIVAILSRKHILELFEQLSQIYRKSKYNVHSFLNFTNDKNK